MAKWHAGTSQDIVECPMCHVYMLPHILDVHLATKHFPVTPGVSVPTTPTSEPARSPSPTSLRCPFCRNIVGQTNKKIIKHLKSHTKITCGLCFSSILMDTFTDHISKCRKAHDATDTCPLCNKSLTSKANKHFKTHITRLECPFSQCSSFPFVQFHNHMTTHVNKFLKEQTVSSKNASNIPQTPTSSESSFSLDSIFPISWDWEEAKSTQPLYNDKSDRHSNNSQLTHTCPVCNIPDIYEGQFESHLQTCLRTQPNPNKCPNCVRTERQVVTLSRHIHHNHFKKLHNCSGCLNTIPCFMIRSHPVQCLNRAPFKLTKQQKVLINSKNITCPICSNQYAKTKLSAHILSHALFQCPVCPWSTDVLNSFTPHVLSCIINESNSSRKSCPVCRISLSKTKFSEHVLNEHSYLCPICNTAMSKNELTFHGLVCTITHQQSTINPNKTNPTPKTKSTSQPIDPKTKSTSQPIDPKTKSTSQPIDPKTKSTSKPIDPKTKSTSQPIDPNEDKSTPKNPPDKQKKSSVPNPKPTLDTSQSLNIPKTPVIPVSKFSCPFCQSKQTDNLETIRTHLYSCIRLQAIPTLKIVNLPDLVGLKIN